MKTDSDIRIEPRELKAYADRWNLETSTEERPTLDRCAMNRLNRLKVRIEH